MSCVTIGWLLGRTIMSPRDTSTSSSSRTVTDIGGKASAISPLAVSIALILVGRPLGSTITSSPGRITPLMTWPAKAR